MASSYVLVIFFNNLIVPGFFCIAFSLDFTVGISAKGVKFAIFVGFKVPTLLWVSQTTFVDLAVFILKNSVFMLSFTIFAIFAVSKFVL